MKTGWVSFIAKALDRAAFVTILAGLLSVAWFASDREPPFQILETYPASARPGEYVTIRARVHREIWRGCSAEFTRYIFDARNVRSDLGSHSASAEMIALMELADPGMLPVNVQLPEKMAIGPAKLVSVLNYRCNRVHYLWPIEVTTSMPFLVVE